MKITVSKFAGFCFGVDRALKLVENNSSKLKKPIFMLGELVHNKYVVKDLRAKGIKVIKNIDHISDGTVIITAHGISPDVIGKLKSKKIAVLDTTCPWVRRVHEAVKIFEKERRCVAIVGDKNHIEVKGIVGELKELATVISNLKEAKKTSWANFENLGIVSQTTQDKKEFEKIANFILNKAKNVQVLNTICDATSKRQADIKRLAKTHNLVIVIGSKNSANTQRLFKIAKKINKKSFLISSAKDFKKVMFRGAKSVAVSGGASTPKTIISKVVKKLESQ